jgi:hypothetical protein
MPNIPLTLSTIGGLVEAADHALADIAASIENKLLDGKRKLTITIEFTPRERYIQTETKVETRLPAKAMLGVAWCDNGVLLTEELCRADEGRQLTHPKLAPVRQGG